MPRDLDGDVGRLPQGLRRASLEIGPLRFTRTTELSQELPKSIEGGGICIDSLGQLARQFAGLGEKDRGPLPEGGLGFSLLSHLAGVPRRGLGQATGQGSHESRGAAGPGSELPGGKALEEIRGG